MNINLNWKRKLLSGTYEIYSDRSLVGNLWGRGFSQSTDAEMNGKEFRFRTKGFIKQHTQIIDVVEDKIIGEIEYNNWMTKATLNISGKEMSWQYDNLWNTKWSLFNNEGIRISYHGSYTKGKIE